MLRHNLERQFEVEPPWKTSRGIFAVSQEIMSEVPAGGKGTEGEEVRVRTAWVVPGLALLRRQAERDG
jgi:hypothetical protein